MNGTEEQKKIWNEMENGNSHMMVYAGAGTGKTYTIVEGAKLVSGKKGFLAFNKSIATELQKKLPNDCDAMTFHSLGLSAIRARRRNVRVETKKNYNIIKTVLGDRYRSGAALNKLIGMLKNSLAEWDDQQAINDIIDEYNIEFDGTLEQREGILSLPTIKEYCMDISIVDFDDMIWLPVVMNMEIKHYDVVFVDEAQDFNECQRKLILKACNGGRMIVVGDPKQAIYGFRGADSASMDIFKRELEKSSRGVDNYTLSITWRCPLSVVNEARRFFKDYFPRDDAPEGAVNANARFTPVAGDLVLCRVNAPLVGHCLRLITAGTPAYVLGRDIGYGLQNLVKKVTADTSMGIDTFLPLLDTYVDNLITAYKRADKDKQIQSLEDKVDCISHLIKNATTVKGVLDNISAVFNSKKGRAVTFSTVHKAKGLEADNVWILKPDVMPHPMATSESDRQQERNLCYVAITRAKNTLNYVGDRIG